jgi:chromosome segregation ATPase
MAELSEIKDQYESKKKDLETLQTEKARLEERLSIKKEKLSELKGDLEERGIDTKDIENEYKTRKSELQDKVGKWEGIDNVKENL